MALAASKRGTAPPVVASGPKVRSRVPLGCPLVEVGTRWHSVQATAWRMALFVRCCWWAPTARVVVAVSPLVPFGGASLVAPPWHELQDPPLTSI